jgi:hypothetical protein
MPKLKLKLKLNLKLKLKFNVGRSTSFSSKLTPRLKLTELKLLQAQAHALKASSR